MFLLGISMITCVPFLVLLVVFLVIYSEVHKLNPMRHELLHLWRIFLACSIVWGGNSTLSDIISTLVLGVYALWHI